MAVNLAVGSLLTLYAYHMAYEPSLTNYPEGLWIVLQTGASAGLAMLGLFTRRGKFFCLAASSTALLLVGLPWAYRGTCFSGGDDGGAMAWFYIVGPVCLVSALMALIALLVGIRRNITARRIRQEFPELAETSSPPKS